MLGMERTSFRDNRCEHVSGLRSISVYQAYEFGRELRAASSSVTMVSSSTFKPFKTHSPPLGHNHVVWVERPVNLLWSEIIPHVEEIEWSFKFVCGRDESFCIVREKTSVEISCTRSRCSARITPHLRRYIHTLSFLLSFHAFAHTAFPRSRFPTGKGLIPYFFTFG